MAVLACSMLCCNYDPHSSCNVQEMVDTYLFLSFFEIYYMLCGFMSQYASVNQCRRVGGSVCGCWNLEVVVSKVVGGFGHFGVAGRGAILGRTGCHQHADPFYSPFQQISGPSPILYGPWSTILSEAIINANAFILSPSNTLFSLESESPRMYPSIQSAGSLIVSTAAQLMMCDTTVFDFSCDNLFDVDSLVKHAPIISSVCATNRLFVDACFILA
ncbi:hypothetical protein EDB92DRAFT_1420281 [Lactarius akahatsu]|uniref:Uncharacterized protein n=1 Tax=Lactarius akahatsu TaxID=416441 RepID=A0AAD4LMQ6_9AGAM|nr:hypothetical protein EDB92DRAFT_1420281 [Lactarius akahatsu]